MAQKIVYIDDIDGSDEGVETLHFSVEGRAYVIDLSAQNRLAFFNAVDRFVEHARRDDTKRPAKQASPKAIAPKEAPTKAFVGAGDGEKKKWEPTHNPGIGRGRVSGPPGIQTRARQWAKDQGMNPPMMGRLPDRYILEYQAASGE